MSSHHHSAGVDPASPSSDATAAAIAVDEWSARSARLAAALATLATSSTPHPEILPAAVIVDGDDQWEAGAFAADVRRRLWPVRRVLLLLPTPGDPRGLTPGDRGSLAAALALNPHRGHAVAWIGAEAAVVLTPVSHHEGLTSWAATRVTSAGFLGTTVEQLPTALRRLGECVLDVERDLVDLGLRSPDGSPRDLIDRRAMSWARGPWPSSLSAQQRAAMLRAASLSLVTDLALDDSVTTSRDDVRRRRTSLHELGLASRRCLEASVSWQ